MKNEFEIRITEDSAEIKGNTLEILEGLANLVNVLEKVGIASEEIIKNTVEIGLKYKEE